MHHLTGTSNPEIKAWLLREGFRNGIMYEYLAYDCAVVGDLDVALARDDADPELLVGAAEILSALIQGGPAQSIEDYACGAKTCVAFLRHMANRPVCDVRALQAVIDIQTLEGDRAAELRKLPGWNAQAFLDLRSLSHGALRQPEARSAVEKALTTADSLVFNTAAQIARHFDIDAWPLRLEHQRSRTLEQWYWLMQSADAGRIERVVTLAREQLDFETICSGPTTSRGLGADYADDRALEYILQDLRRFPGRGADLVLRGLRARVIRTRNMAIRVLREWRREDWPANACRS